VTGGAEALGRLDDGAGAFARKPQAQTIYAA